MAIEALSRGSEHAWLVEKSADAQRAITDNLERCGLKDRATLLKNDAWKALPMLLNTGPFDLIFIDPPYGKGLAQRALEEIERVAVLSPGGIICVETGAREELPAEVGQLCCSGQRRYGTVLIHMYTFRERDNQ